MGIPWSWRNTICTGYWWKNSRWCQTIWMSCKTSRWCKISEELIGWTFEGRMWTKASLHIRNTSTINVSVGITVHSWSLQKMCKRIYISKFGDSDISNLIKILNLILLKGNLLFFSKITIQSPQERIRM